MAAAQLVWLGIAQSRTAGPAVPTMLLGRGAMVTSIAGSDISTPSHQSSQVVPIANEEGLWTVLFAYNDSCPISRSVIDGWVQGFETLTANPDLRVVVVTRGQDIPYHYARSFSHLGVSTISVAAADRSSDAFAIAALTPWYYLFDPDGMLVLEDHGSALDNLYAALEHYL